MRARKDWRRVGDAVAARRVQLGYTSREGVPGVGRATLDKLELGKQESYKPRTLKLLEEALQWPHGAILSISDGGPIPDGEPVPPDLGDEVRALRQELAELHEEFRKQDRVVSQLLERLGDVPPQR